ncbi:hypothetical protein BHE74_00047135 [Ensete ventricosum]|nr:hypothetical protein BHE74_00047135 [Ensete ventricosum]
MRIACYRAILSKIDCRRSISAVGSRLREKKARRRRGKEKKKKRRRRKPSAVLARAPSPPSPARCRRASTLAHFFSCARDDVSLHGEKDRRPAGPLHTIVGRAPSPAFSPAQETMSPRTGRKIEATSPLFFSLF